MMGVYIKGMEMPSDCHNCPFGFGGGCYFGTSADEYMCPDHGRAEWCPLVHVPPHGRLIDADALMERIDADWNGRTAFRAATIVEYINDATTIIPPSGGKENE